MALDDFDIDSSTQAAWADFAANLAEVLSVMDDSSDLTISVAKGLVGGEPPAIRFSASGSSIVAHIRPGVSAPGQPDPSDDELELLRALGWDQLAGAGDGWSATAEQEDTEELAKRTADTLQQVFDVIHPVFIEADDLAEILRGTASWQQHSVLPARPEDVAVMPASLAELDHAVDVALERIFGHPALRNPDGDVAIRVGSSMVFLRSTPDAQEIVLFSPLVHDVDGRSRACEVLNDLNVESRYGRFALHRDRVYVQLSVQAKPFVPAHLHEALRVLSQIADGIDDDLAEKLGGRTTFPQP